MAGAEIDKETESIAVGQIAENDDTTNFYNDLKVQLCWISPALKRLWTCDVLKSQQVRLGLNMCAICPRISIQIHIRYDAFRQVERAWFKVVFLFGGGKKKSRLLGPPFCSQVGGKTRLWKKSQHKSPLIFIYAAPPFSGFARPI